MGNETRRVEVAEIPAGQTIDLFVAVGAVLTAALESVGMTMLGPGSTGSAAMVSLNTDQPNARIVHALERAAKKLRKLPKPLPVPVEEPVTTGGMSLSRVTARENEWVASLGFVEPTEAQATLLFLADAMRQSLGDAPNYVQMEFTAPRDTPGMRERFFLTVQRAEGKSPATLREIAEARVAELESELAALKAKP